MSSARNLLELKRKALALGLCGKYKAAWDAAADAETVFRLAMDANGIEFLADGIAFGWGLPAGYIAREFAGYVNGYVCHEDGYTSQLFVGTSGVLAVTSTLSLLAGHHGVVRVPRGMVSKVYLCGGSDVSLECAGVCDVVAYADGTRVAVGGSFGGRVSQSLVEKSAWV